MFALQNAPEAEAGSGGLLISPVRAETRTSILDLFLSARDSDQGIGLILDYSTDLFSEAWAKDFLQGFAALLQAISERPAATVKELHELLTETARRQKNLRLQELKMARSQMLEGVRARSTKRSEPLAV
jgi:hypothetical protein